MLDFAPGEFERSFAVSIPSCAFAIGEWSEPSQECPRMQIISCVDLMREPSEGFQPLVHLPDQILDIVRRMRKSEFRMKEMGA